MNVRGFSEVEKRNKIELMLEECILDILGWSETKLGGEEGMSFMDVGGVKSGL